jgi:hypothetical protein
VIKMHVVAVLIAIAIIGIGAGGYVAYDSGYIPITETLTVEEPIEGKPVDIETYEQRYKNITMEIPNYDKIKKQLYESDYTAFEIYLDYKQKLEQEGYHQEKIGSTEINEIPVKYYSFLKGLTAVAFIIVLGEDIGRGCESVVLYTTGNALDYQEIIEWYQTG